MSARDDRIREGIEPLAPGERPPVITAATAIVAALAVANLALALAGRSLEGGGDARVGGVVFGVLMLVLAIGLWRVRYWAAIGFQIVLGVTGVSAALGLLVASNLAAVLLCVGLLAASGTLFWFLIRAMARIQAPRG